MAVRLVVFGRQGAGKGTQCARLSEHYGAPHISTGDMLRDAVAEGTDFGLKAKEYMDSGQLLPDDIMLGIIEDRLNKADAVEHGFLLDGFPRTVGQAKALSELTTIDRAVNIEVPEELVMERMMARKRADDTPEAITTRLDAYATKTLLAVAYFDSLGLLTTVDGVGDMDDVTERLIAAVDATVGSAAMFKAPAVPRKSAEQIAKMRVAGRVVAEMHEAIRAKIAPGVTTAQLDKIGRAVIEKRGATSNFLNYHGFPAVICASPNDMIVHGIPGSYRLADGDLISIDCGAIVDGWHGDAAFTAGVGSISAEAQRLIEVTEASLHAGIAQMVPGNRIGDIGHAVQQVAEAAGFSVVREYVGHAIGTAMHEDPQVPNYGPAGKGPKLRAGNVFAVEPMVNVGSPDTDVLADGWSVVTADGSLSAHWEHTIAIGDDGPEILTILS